MGKNISRRDFLKAAGAASLMSVSVSACTRWVSSPSGKSVVSRPNVVLVLTDDQGYGDLSCHGNPILKTPNLDKLYAESTRFTDYHVAPMCTPTRGELLTGKQAFRNGAVFVCQGKSMIRRGIPTMAEMFRAGGYTTGHFGKWHLGDNNPYRPQDRGFDETVHHGAWGITSMADYWDNDYFDRPGVVLWKKWRLVHGDELYNLADDPGQRKNVIEKYPDVAAELRLHYTKWVEEMTPLQKQVNYTSIGADSEPTAMLCSANWIGSYADSWGNLLDKEERIKNGYWDLQVEKSGKYKIELYGWPKQTGAAFGDKFTGGVGDPVPGRRVAKAKLKLGEEELTMKTAPTEFSAVFTVSLKKGDKLCLQSWLYDKNGKDLGGAYFVYITKL
jgi:hypothetical protein